MFQSHFPRRPARLNCPRPTPCTNSLRAWVVFGVAEMLLMILPKGLQRRVNQIRFGPGWKGRIARAETPGPFYFQQHPRWPRALLAWEVADW